MEGEEVKELSDGSRYPILGGFESCSSGVLGVPVLEG